MAGRVVQGVLGDTWHGDKAECGRCVQKRRYCPGCRVQIRRGGKTDLIKIDERGTGRQEGEDGDWVEETRWTK
jgi:hypothetical protein